MQPRREPLLWLQCLALGAIPLELLLIRLVLAGADPGPVPGVERVLIWGVGVLAPAVALWRRPADWGSLLLVRQPLASRSSEQLRISASHSGISSRVAVAIAAVSLLPVLWWLDDSAVLASEFSPVSGQSRLVTLLLVSPLLALMVWQVQQMVQSAALLLGSPATVAPADWAFRADDVATQRTSLGLQWLDMLTLEWPEPAVKPSTQRADEVMSVENIESGIDNSSSQVSTEDVSAIDESSANEEPDDESSAVKPVTASVFYEADPETTHEPVVAEAPANEESSGDSEDIDQISDQEADQAIDLEDSESRTDECSDNEEPNDAESEAALEPVDPQAQVEEPEDISTNGTDESTVAAAGSIAVEPEQPREE